MRLLSGLALGFWLSGCTAPPADPAPPSPPGCPDLDHIFQQSDHFISSLNDQPGWPLHSDSLLHLLQANLDAPEACKYLNHQYLPARPRFDFVEFASEKTIEDTLTQGITFLIRLRGIFSLDPDIMEFLSEELGHIALNNPTVYATYLTEHPGHKQMLLNSTRWDPLLADRLTQKFAAIPNGAPVLQFLTEWRKGFSPDSEGL